MKKLLVSALLLLVIVIAIIVLTFRSPINLNADNITEIEIAINDKLPDDEEVEIDDTLILNRQDDMERIETIITHLRKSKKHPDQEAGTTHPIYVSITMKDHKQIRFWVGVGDFVTLSYNEKQYNYINQELNDYIVELIKSST